VLTKQAIHNEEVNLTDPSRSVSDPCLNINLVLDEKYFDPDEEQSQAKQVE